MAQKAVTINQVSGVQSTPTNNGEVIVWSALRYPLTLTFPASRFAGKTDKGARHHTEKITLKPGANRVAKHIWDHNRNKPTIQKRLDMRDLLVTSTSAMPRELVPKLALIEKGVPVEKYTTIDNLCPVASGVTMKAALKDAGAGRGIADMDDESAAITLES